MKKKQPKFTRREFIHASAMGTAGLTMGSGIAGCLEGPRQPLPAPGRPKLSRAHLSSFRDYVETLKNIGEIQEIDCEVDWHLEAGAIIRRSYDLKAPAPLFNNIKDSAQGFRLLGAPAALSRQRDQRYCRPAISLGLPPSASFAEVIETLSRVPEVKPIRPKPVSTGLCKQNIILGDQVDLLKFPVPFLHQGDGGRYINTWGTIIVRTPDRSWTNWAIARIMVHDRKTMTGMISPRQHLGVVMDEWKKIGEPMPFALALGCPPVTPFVSSMAVDRDVDEADLIGGFIGKPLELVKGETVDLMVPASAEIVIEGRVHYDDLKPEGPMGEYSGYMPGTKHSMAPSYHVSAISHRDDPILPAVCAGEPVEECHTCWALGVAAKVLSDLRKNGFPVVGCSCPPEAALHFLAVSVDIDAYKGDDIVAELADLVFTSKAGKIVPKIILVDKDVDVTDTNAVLWAFATRCHT
ncbi:MAG: UbiD family decarboxylase, partial [Deltaproteobacteria bacterium]|nr:UbiD family decarboxylase [Deltaproteobacteria bacterium]